MKRALLFLLAALSAGAATRFEWDANPEPDVCAYRLYVGTSSRVYTKVLEAGCATTLLIPDDFGYAAVTAVNMAGLESDFSEEVHFFPRLLWQLPPGNVLVESSVDLGQGFILWLPWAQFVGPKLYELPVDKQEPQRFFRYTVLP